MRRREAARGSGRRVQANRAGGIRVEFTADRQARGRQADRSGNGIRRRSQSSQASGEARQREKEHLQGSSRSYPGGRLLRPPFFYPFFLSPPFARDDLVLENHSSRLVDFDDQTDSLGLLD